MVDFFEPERPMMELLGILTMLHVPLVTTGVWRVRAQIQEGDGLI